ncbi:MAG: YodL domain-containing protein [Oscillospiraceae bacterium]
MSYQDKKDKMKEITDRLEQGIKDIYDSEHYKNYLTVMSKFHSYSYRNSLLIMLQKPEATLVAGFNAWKNNFKRYVNKGEKGIQILAPAPYRVKMEMEKIDPKTQRPVLDSKGNPVTEEVKITKPSFRPVHVFDVSQTSGEPLPQLTTELSGNVAQYQAFFESLKSVFPFPIQFEDIQSGAKGYCDPVNQKIAIKNGMSEIENIKTAIHEITHADLHADQSKLSLDEKKDRRTKEMESESVAFVVCNHFGIDTSDYSFAYLAAWSSGKELKEIQNNLDTIQKQAAELIDRIDTRFQELLKEQPVLPMPDNTISISDMEQYGYKYDEVNKMLPLSNAKAVELFEKDDPIYLLYEDNTEAIPDTKDYVINHFEKGGIAGIEQADWKNIIEFDEFKKETAENLNEAMEVLKDEAATVRDGSVAINLPDNTEKAFDLTKEPIVTIIWSKNSLFKDGDKFTISQANTLFKELDSKQREDREKEDYKGSWYDKTKLNIEYQKECEIRTFTGRQDIGDGDGSLIEHIKSYAEHNLNDPYLQNFLSEKGEQQEANASYQYILTEFVPYLEMHDTLGKLEIVNAAALNELKSSKENDNNQDMESKISYYQDTNKYIDTMRTELNNSKEDYNFPEIPRLENYLVDKINMEAYKEQVREEIKLEVLMNGMTVDEYAKNGYEAPQERTFTLYQLKSGEDNHYRRFISYEMLDKQGEQPDIKNYENVYSGKMEQSATLENIYQEFNINRSEDFKGHSLSMSDIIVVEANGAYTANYIDTFGYVNCPDFAKEHHLILQTETLDSLKFDNDIDLDKEKTREQLGFKNNEKPLPIAERMAVAKKDSKERMEASKETKKNTSIEREER